MYYWNIKQQRSNPNYLITLLARVFASETQEKRVMTWGLTINHKVENVTTSEKDSMVFNYAVGTKDKGVREQKCYMDFNNPEECKRKIASMLQIKDYANNLINPQVSNEIMDLTD